MLFTENGAWEITWRGSKELPKDRFDRYRDSRCATFSTSCACACTSLE